MTQENGAAASQEGCVWFRPWRVLLVSLGAVVIGTVLMPYDGPIVTPIRLLLMLAGLIVGGRAVQRRLSASGEHLDERVESAGFVAVYSLEGLLGFLGMAEPWFSGRIFFGFFIVATIVGSLLVLMPRVWRRLAATVLILFHFGGIVAISAAAPASNGQSAWLPTVLVSEVYRPYLYGLFLTNAYHFYAPDPGSTTLVWMRIEYEDGTYKWLNLPNREVAETPLHYQREMGMCEATSHPGPPISAETFSERLFKRRRAGAWRGPGNEVPLRTDQMEYTQYNEPDAYSKLIMKSMARHACHYYPNEEHPDSKAKFVKIYRLTYIIITPEALLQGGDPLDDKLKTPFYMGEYDSEGTMVLRDEKGEVTEKGEEVLVHDPFLYWVVPMAYLGKHSGDIKVVNPREAQ
jgi:hypothetical protein